MKGSRATVQYLTSTTTFIFKDPQNIGNWWLVTNDQLKNRYHPDNSDFRCPGLIVIEMRPYVEQNYSNFP